MLLLYTAVISPADIFEETLVSVYLLKSSDSEGNHCIGQDIGYLKQGQASTEEIFRLKSLRTL